MFDNASRTEISPLGEFGLIDHIAASVNNRNKNLLKGIGDDAAVIDLGNGKVQLFGTDMLVEGVHFDLSYTPLKHLGYKAVTVNLSDIYAMNGTPEYITVSIAISNRFSLEAVEELYTGINLACERYGVDLAGGDTTTCRSGLIISIAVTGTGEKDKITYRSGAKENDLICVSGDLGAAYTGLQLLEREKRIYLENPNIQPDLAGKDYIIERQLKPEARKDIVKWLSEKNIIPTSMMDISDGLSSELHHIARQSGVGIRIYEDKLPVDTVTVNSVFELGLETTLCAVNGGEDYELLFTVSQEHFDTVKDSADISIIGHCTEKDSGVLMISRENNSYKLDAQGWRHF